MSNARYPTAAQGFLNGSLDWDTQTFRVYAFDGLVFDGFHDFLNDITAIATPLDLDTIAGRTVTFQGYALADPSTITVDIGDTLRQLLIVQWTGTESTSRLVAFMDTNSDSTPISRAGDGAAFPINWPIDGIFALT